MPCECNDEAAVVTWLVWSGRVHCGIVCLAGNVVPSNHTVRICSLLCLFQSLVHVRPCQSRGLLSCLTFYSSLMVSYWINILIDNWEFLGLLVRNIFHAFICCNICDCLLCHAIWHSPEEWNCWVIHCNHYISKAGPLAARSMDLCSAMQ